MKLHQYISIILIFISATLLSGCNQKPKVSEIFKAQLMKFLEEGAKTNAKAEQGVSYLELREQIASTKAAYDLLKSTWPPSLTTEMQPDFDHALTAWDLTLDLWKLKIGNKDNPAEPDINGWHKYMGDFESLLDIRVHPADYIVSHYRGKRYIPFDENISILLTIAGTHFNQGRQKVLEKL